MRNGSGGGGGGVSWVSGGGGGRGSSAGGGGAGTGTAVGSGCGAGGKGGSGSFSVSFCRGVFTCEPPSDRYPDVPGVPTERLSGVASLERSFIILCRGDLLHTLSTDREVLRRCLSRLITEGGGEGEARTHLPSLLPL